jgi:hypothetical protein
VRLRRENIECGEAGIGGHVERAEHQILKARSRIAHAKGVYVYNGETSKSVGWQSERPSLMAWFEKLAIVAFMVLFMEYFAWAAHRYVMRGWGWGSGWHKSHHEDHEGWFEKNDLYAIVPIVLFVVGLKWEPLWWAALGITVYGSIYAFVHDLLVHQRGGFRWVPKQGYLSGFCRRIAFTTPSRASTALSATAFSSRESLRCSKRSCG